MATLIMVIALMAIDSFPLKKLLMKGLLILISALSLVSCAAYPYHGALYVNSGYATAPYYSQHSAGNHYRSSHYLGPSYYSPSYFGGYRNTYRDADDYRGGYHSEYRDHDYYGGRHHGYGRGDGDEGYREGGRR